jgi:hypothetical protein
MHIELLVRSIGTQAENGLEHLEYAGCRPALGNVRAGRIEGRKAVCSLTFHSGVDLSPSMVLILGLVR